jgi:hypothetical protein
LLANGGRFPSSDESMFGKREVLSITKEKQSAQQTCYNPLGK